MMTPALVNDTVYLVIAFCPTAFDGRGAISGKLIVVPPEGRDVTHRGIEITLSSTSRAHMPPPRCACVRSPLC